MRGSFNRNAPRPAHLAGRWVLWTDVQLTRRKRYFIIEDPQGDNQYMASRISLALDWLDAHEISMYMIAAPEAAYEIQVLAVTLDERT